MEGTEKAIKHKKREETTTQRSHDAAYSLERVSIDLWYQKRLWLTLMLNDHRAEPNNHTADLPSSSRS